MKTMIKHLATMACLILTMAACTSQEDIEMSLDTRNDLREIKIQAIKIA